jgi:sugar diacid utilization regulator
MNKQNVLPSIPPPPPRTAAHQDQTWERHKEDHYMRMIEAYSLASTMEQEIESLKLALKQKQEPMVLYTENYPGNLHAVSAVINKQGLAEFVIGFQVVPPSGSTVVVLRLPESHRLVQERRERAERYVKEQSRL